MEEDHAGVTLGHFSGPKINVQDNNYHINGGGTVCIKTLSIIVREKMPIPVDHLFQIVGVEIMELPLATNWNRYAIVF